MDSCIPNQAWGHQGVVAPIQQEAILRSKQLGVVSSVNTTWPICSTRVWERYCECLGNIEQRKEGLHAVPSAIMKWINADIYSLGCTDSDKKGIGRTDPSASAGNAKRMPSASDISYRLTTLFSLFVLDQNFILCQNAGFFTG